jgi:hypothetical protein
MVERLVEVHPSVAAKHPATIWTNCTVAEPCAELAVLDTISDFFSDAYIGLSMTADGEEQSQEQFQEQANLKSHLLLRPGTYRWSSEVGSYPRRKRVDTFALEAGHRYSTNRQWIECEGLFRSSKAKRALVCEAPREETTFRTNWFEDVATKRVVAGQKWCGNDAECPESHCSKGDGQPRGVCDIPELQCTYGESCVPR